MKTRWHRKDLIDLEYFLHLASTLPDQGKARLKEIFLSKTLENKNGVIAAEFDLQASVNHAFKVADQYNHHALKALDVLPPSEERDALECVVDFVLHRKL